MRDLITSSRCSPSSKGLRYLLQNVEGRLTVFLGLSRPMHAMRTFRRPDAWTAAATARLGAEALGASCGVVFLAFPILFAGACLPGGPARVHEYDALLDNPRKFERMLYPPDMLYPHFIL